MGHAGVLIASAGARSSLEAARSLADVFAAVSVALSHALRAGVAEDAAAETSSSPQASRRCAARARGALTAVRQTATAALAAVISAARFAARPRHCPLARGLRREQTLLVAAPATRCQPHHEPSTESTGLSACLRGCLSARCAVGISVGVSHRRAVLSHRRANGPFSAVNITFTPTGAASPNRPRETCPGATELAGRNRTSEFAAPLPWGRGVTRTPVVPVYEFIQRLCVCWRVSRAQRTKERLSAAALGWRPARSSRNGRDPPVGMFTCRSGGRGRRGCGGV